MFTDVISGSFDGLLIVGDPHIASRRPGRRTDDYLTSSLDKLDQAADIANAQNLLTIITGDLIHRDDESSTTLIHRLLRTLKRFKHTPIDVEGNHGKQQSKLGLGDIESIMADADALHVVSDVRLFADISVQGQRIQVFSCPHGSSIPSDLKPLGASDGAIRVLITHHDLAFENDYPGSLPLPEIQSCDVAINGHMHKTSPSIQKGATLWHCPGNTEPLSIDVRDHKPAVWVQRGSIGNLTPIYLRHDPDCFNLTGLQVAAMEGVAAVQALEPSAMLLPEVPEFLAELQAQDANNIERTDDASALANDVDAVLAESDASEATQLFIRTLVARVTAKHA